MSRKGLGRKPISQLTFVNVVSSFEPQLEQHSLITHYLNQ